MGFMARRQVAFHADILGLHLPNGAANVFLLLFRELLLPEGFGDFRMLAAGAVAVFA